MKSIDISPGSIAKPEEQERVAPYIVHALEQAQDEHHRQEACQLGHQRDDRAADADEQESDPQDLMAWQVVEGPAAQEGAQQISEGEQDEDLADLIQRAGSVFC